MADLNITPLRRRVLQALDQRGAIAGQDIGFEFIKRNGGRDDLKTPQSATRMGCGFMVALVKAGLASWSNTEGLGGTYRITGAGREAVRRG